LAAEKQERPAVEADPATPSNLRPSHNIAFLRAYQIPGLSENPVRQRMVATVAYHVRMNGEGHGALPKARNQRMKSLRRNRPGALWGGHIRTGRLLALKTTQRPQFVTLDRMNARRPALSSAHVQVSRIEFNLVPL
jgi:hypothetical protein